MKRNLVILTFALSFASAPALAVTFHSLHHPTLVNTGTGFDGFIGTADDADFAAFGIAINPTGSASVFSWDDPTLFGLPATGAAFGFTQPSQLSLVSALGDQVALGTNTYTGLNTVFEGNFFDDAATLTPAESPPGTPLLNQPVGTFARAAAPASTATFGPGNAFGFSLSSTDGVTIASQSSFFGAYLVNGQDPGAVFAGIPEAAAHFDAILPLLPVDWTVATLAFAAFDFAGITGVGSYTYFSTELEAIPQPVPLPGALPLLAVAFAGIGARRRPPNERVRTTIQG